MLPQILGPRTRSPADLTEGLYLVLLGLFNKVVIADNMAPIVNTVFASGSHPSGAEALIGLYAFAFQIYGDFSGYSSIARGIAKWLGFDLMINFETPYFSTSIREFWRRWHISLSTWLRDYLYVPLGGSRLGEWYTYRNLMNTMVLGGLWHGAAWTFIAWGFFHGILLSMQRVVKGSAEIDPANSGLIRNCALTFVTFNLVCLGWLMFRAESMTQAWNMLSAIFVDFRVTAFALSSGAIMCFYVGPLVVYEWWVQNKPDVVSLMQAYRLPALGLSYCLVMLWFFPSPRAHEFIYFQF
jgi:D-alanyl-lipoteichoic acid acyltransferase DltB (MBOAT superfamily)